MNTPLPGEPNYTAEEGGEIVANLMDQYVTGYPNQTLGEYALYANESVEFDFPDSMPQNYFDAFAYDPHSYGWHEPMSYPTYQASTQASEYEKKAMESQQFTFEIDWDYGQTRGLYDFADDPIVSDEYYNESDGEEAVDDEEEVVQEPEEDAQAEKKPEKGQ